MGALFGLINFGTYRAASYIETLQIPSHLFEEFVARNRIFNEIQRVQDRIEFMRVHTFIWRVGLLSNSDEDRPGDGAVLS